VQHFDIIHISHPEHLSEQDAGFILDWSRRQATAGMLFVWANRIGPEPVKFFGSWKTLLWGFSGEPPTATGWYSPSFRECKVTQLGIGLPVAPCRDLYMAPKPPAAVGTFPESMLRYFLGAVARPGMRMLDPACGTGESLRVAEDLGLEAAGVESKPELREVAQQSLVRKHKLAAAAAVAVAAACWGKKSGK
jgi:hypothetical protein